MKRMAAYTIKGIKIAVRTGISIFRYKSNSTGRNKTREIAITTYNSQKIGATTQQMIIFQVAKTSLPSIFTEEAFRAATAFFLERRSVMIATGKEKKRPGSDSIAKISKTERRQKRRKKARHLLGLYVST
eukprot:Lithocolla_globosa_v1_NODE_3185_length_1738_cov_6.920380.p2 type:complete len:130 gc:universal NODE_3185_length_1738_cov_6.920380:142-531(+)